MVYHRRRYYRRRRSPVYRRRFKRGPAYRRRSYRRFRRGRLFPPKKGNFSGWPEINYVKHVWRDSTRVGPTSVTGNIINWASAIRANSVYDPWISADIQESPSRFVAMSSLYSKHTVLGSKITVTISGPAGGSLTGAVKTDQTEYVACLRCNDNDGSAALSSLDQYMAAADRKNRWKRCTLSPMICNPSESSPQGGDGHPTRVTMHGTWSLKRDCGGTDSTNAVWTASGETDPDEERFYLFGLAYADSSGQSYSPGYLVEVRVEYFVKWENLKDLMYTGA